MPTKWGDSVNVSSTHKTYLNILSRNFQSKQCKLWQAAIINFSKHAVTWHFINQIAVFFCNLYSKLSSFLMPNPLLVFQVSTFKGLYEGCFEGLDASGLDL